MSSTGDLFLSRTANFCRALDLAGVENKLVVFDGLPHAFWAYIDVPESDDAFRIMAKFFTNHLGKSTNWRRLQIIDRSQRFDVALQVYRNAISWR